VPLCKECYEESVRVFKEYREDKIQKGKLFPCLNEIIEGKLWLGNEDTALSLEELEERKISHILVAGANLCERFPGKFIYLTLDL
jgi:hypothetical protein